MNLYIVRHGDAKPIGGPVTSDSERPLSGRGEQDVQLMGQVLSRVEGTAPRIVSSPLLRARTTAELLGASYVPTPGVDLWEDLAPGVRFKQVFSSLQ